MAVIHFSKEGFDKALEQGSPMLIDFWASWCGPCKALAPVVEKLAGKFEGRVTVGKVDVDEEQDLAARYKIRSVPTLILFKDGEEAARSIGVQTQGDLEQFVEENI